MPKVIFEKVLKEVYDQFYETLLNDKYYKSFFENKDIEEIKIRQKQNIITHFAFFMDGNIQEVKQNYLRLAKLHEELGLDLSSYIDGINYLEILIIRHLFKNYKTIKFDRISLEDFFQKIEEFFELIKNTSAVGYMQNIIKREKVILKEFVEANIDYKLSELKDLIDKHIQWKEQIFGYILNETKQKPDLSVHSCGVGKWLDTIKEEEKNREEKLKQIIQLHNKLHESAKNIIALKEKEKFIQLMTEYNNLVKLNLLFLSAIIAFATSRHIDTLQKDALTNTLSRRLLRDILISVMDLSILSGEPFAVAFLDIDNFKRINDTYGHQVGDKVLVEIAKLLQKNLRNSDYIFRYGGEEFLIVFTSVKDLTRLFEVLDNVRQLISSLEIDANGEKINITASIGAVIVKEDKRVSIESIIHQADELMYEAKRTGKNKVLVDIFKK